MRFFYQEIWQNERQEYESQSTKGRRQFEDGILWKQSMVERKFEEEGVEDKIRLFFSKNSRQVKEKLQQQQVKKSYNKEPMKKMKQY